MPSKSFGHRGAFTLVELLVVIGIIAVLISLLLPALGRAREVARIAACASNEHQIMLQFFMYASSQRGYLPPFCRGSNGHWNYSTQTYIPDIDPSTGQDVFYRGWDQILANTVMGMTDVRRDSQMTTGANISWFRMFLCPDDNNPRDTVKYPNIPFRSYAVNQSKFDYGCSDSKNGVGAGFHAPWSPGNMSNGTFEGHGALVVQTRLDQVPQWIWILGENWGTSGVYGYPANAAQTYGQYPATPDGAVFGQFDNACLDGSPSRFHGTSAMFITRTNSNSNGGNYGYPDGHVEFVKWNDCQQYRSDSDTRGVTIYKDHWKWCTTR